MKWAVDKMAAGTIPASFSGLKKTDSLPGCLQNTHARKGFGMPNFQNPRSSSIRIRFTGARNSSSDIAEMKPASEGSPLLVPRQKYCESIYKTIRRKTRTVMVGNVPLGSEHPIRVQTMTTTDTKDVLGTVEQVMGIADRGADLVRITVQGKKRSRCLL